MRFLCLALLVSAASLHAAEGLAVSFNTTTAGGQYNPRHIMAVWVETNAAAFVRTIGNWSGTRRVSLTQWRAKAGTTDTDAVMGATVTTHAVRTTSTWNMTAKSTGLVVADGSYKVWLESVDKDNPTAGTTSITGANRFNFTFVKDGVTRTAPVTDATGKFVNISYAYTGRTPTIANPALAIAAGASTTFTATNNAAVAPSSYQWRKGGVNISGATAATYTIASAVTGDAGSYTCVLVYPDTYGLGSVVSMTSNALALTVTAGTIAVTSVAVTPASSTVNPGATVTLTAAPNPANATSPSYAWFRNTTSATTGGTAVGTNAATYSPVTSASGTLYYYCTVTAGGATVTSNSAAVIVRAPPVISAQPASVTVAAGAVATFAVTASDGGFAANTYQWQSLPVGGSWSAISGATATSYITPATSAASNGTQYRCIVTNAGGAGVAVTSSAATLTVASPPTITTNLPASLAAIGGGTLSFTIAATIPATPAGALSYQWQYRASAAAGWGNVGTSATTYSRTAAANGEQVRCLVTNTVNGVAASTTSQVTTVTVSSPSAPAFTTQPASVSVLVGATATFTVAVSGVPTPTLQWQSSADGVTFANLGGATSATYTTAATTAGDVGVPRYYRCIATNSVNTVTSTTATRTVTAPTAGTAYISFTPTASGGSYAGEAKHVVAAWIQQGSTFVTTLGTWAGERQSSLTQWLAVKGSGTDAVMGATRVGFTPVVNLLWNFDSGTVPDGTYTLWLESSDENPVAPGTTSAVGVNRGRLDFVIAGGSVVQVTGADGGFAGIRIAGTAEAVTATTAAAQTDGKVSGCGSGGLYAMLISALAVAGLRRRRRAEAC